MDLLFCFFPETPANPKDHISVKPVKHEHTIEVKIPASLEDTTNKVRDHLEENKKPYLFGVGGIVLGFAISRVFSRPSVNVEVIVQKDA